MLRKLLIVPLICLLLLHVHLTPVKASDPDDPSSLTADYEIAMDESYYDDFVTPADSSTSKSTYTQSGATGGIAADDLNPFADCVNGGEETVNLSTLGLNVTSPILNLPGRGGTNLTLTRVNVNSCSLDGNISTNDFTNHKMHPGCMVYGAWTLAGIPMCINKVLYLQDGRYFSFDNYTASNSIDCGNIIATADSSGTGSVVLSDGVTIKALNTSTKSQQIIYPNGNTITLYFEVHSDSYTYTTTQYVGKDDDTELVTVHTLYDTWWALSKIKDSIGRIINISYDGWNMSKITQTLADDSVKTLLTISVDGSPCYDTADYTVKFTDALSRTTTQAVDASEATATFTYPNGSISKYVFGSSTVTHTLYESGSSTAFKTETYTGSSESDGIYGSVSVSDGVSVKKYTLTQGYATTELDYDSSGTLLQKIIKGYEYTYDPRDSGRYFAQPTSVSQYLCTNGTVSSTPATWTYSYDDYHNLTYICNPNGITTRMCYANSDYWYDFSKGYGVDIITQNAASKVLITPETSYKLNHPNRTIISWTLLYTKDSINYYQAIFQDPGDSALVCQACLYTTGVGYHQMISKATLVKDSVNNTTQYKQTHYKYNSSTGVLEQTSEVYNDGYLQTYFTYDDYGNVLTKTDPNGNELCYSYSDTYDSAYLTQIAKSDGTLLAKFGYDFDTGNQTTATDGKGNVTNSMFDAIGRVTEQYMNSSDTTVKYDRQITYDDANSTATIKFGNSSVDYQQALITYDSLLGKPVLQQRKVSGNWVTQKQLEYDSNGRLSWEMDGNSHKTAYTYDTLDRQTKITQPSGDATQFAYADRTVTTTDANGNKKVETYDLLDRLTAVTEYPSSSTSYTTSFTYDTYYDNSGEKPDYHLVMITNPRDARTIFSYDNLGRLISTEYPQVSTNPMTTETMTYDSVGNMLTMTNGNGTTTYTYDFNDKYQLKKVLEPGDKTVSFTYDTNNNILTKTTSDTVYKYTYDARNRVTAVNAALDSYSFDLQYTYDTFNRLASVTYPGRSSAVSYTYNDLDLLQTVSDFVTGCSYDTDNKLTEMDLANGISQTYSYDSNDRPTAIKARSLLSLSYSYDSVGNITQINDDYFGYDGMNRLTWYGSTTASAASPTGTAWTYDSAGNISTKETYSAGVSQGSVAFTNDLANRLMSMGSVTYTNDTAGNRTEKASGSNTWVYSYDGASRLTDVTKNNVEQVQCAYDGDGMRYKKVENSKTLYYLYMGNDPLVEYNATDGTYNYRIYAGKNAIAEENAGVVKYYHKDLLGSTRVVSDSTGSQVAAYKYTPYGEIESSSGTGVVTNAI